MERTYSALMESGHPFIRLKLDTHQPMELGEFVSAFTALASQYDKYVRDEKPDADPEATLFVNEVRKGCIEADLIPWLGAAAFAAHEAIAFTASAITLSDFVNRYGSKLAFYKNANARDEAATTSELNDFFDQVAGIANSRNSSLSIASYEYEKGKARKKASFEFDTGEARAIRDTVSERKRELEQTSDANHKRVLLVLKQTSVKPAKLGAKRTGDRGVIESLGGSKDLGIVYASELAEQRFKEEIRAAQDNVYLKGFEVDVNVESRNGKPIAYRIMHVHDVIDLPDD